MPAGCGDGMTMPADEASAGSGVRPPGPSGRPGDGKPVMQVQGAPNGAGSRAAGTPGAAAFPAAVRACGNPMPG